MAPSTRQQRELTKKQYDSDDVTADRYGTSSDDEQYEIVFLGKTKAEILDSSSHLPWSDHLKEIIVYKAFGHEASPTPEQALDLVLAIGVPLNYGKRVAKVIITKLFGLMDRILRHDGSPLADFIREEKGGTVKVAHVLLHAIRNQEFRWSTRGDLLNRHDALGADRFATMNPRGRISSERLAKMVIDKLVRSGRITKDKSDNNSGPTFSSPPPQSPWSAPSSSMSGYYPQTPTPVHGPSSAHGYSAPLSARSFSNPAPMPPAPQFAAYGFTSPAPMGSQSPYYPRSPAGPSSFWPQSTSGPSPYHQQSSTGPSAFYSAQSPPSFAIPTAPAFHSPPIPDLSQYLSDSASETKFKGEKKKKKSSPSSAKKEEPSDDSEESSSAADVKSKKEKYKTPKSSSKSSTKKTSTDQKDSSSNEGKESDSASGVSSSKKKKKKKKSSSQKKLSKKSSKSASHRKAKNDDTDSNNSDNEASSSSDETKAKSKSKSSSPSAPTKISKKSLSSSSTKKKKGGKKAPAPSSDNSEADDAGQSSSAESDKESKKKPSKSKSKSKKGKEKEKKSIKTEEPSDHLQDVLQQLNLDQQQQQQQNENENRLVMALQQCGYQDKQIEEVLARKKRGSEGV